MSEEKVLGVGTYGCAIYPAKSCTPEHERLDNYVAKVFSDRESYEEEIKQNKKIKNLDPSASFTLLSGLPNSYCKIGKIYNLKNCGNPQRWGIPDKYYQIIYKMGGRDLEKIMSDINDNTFAHSDPETKFSYLKYLSAFSSILYGFGKNEWIDEKKAHNDIKGMNITITNEGKGNLIDFGLMMRCKDIYDEKEFNANQVYLYWPPEFIIFNILSKLLFSDVNKDKTTRQWINYIDSKIQLLKENSVETNKLINIALTNPLTFQNYYMNPEKTNFLKEINMFDEAKNIARANIDEDDDDDFEDETPLLEVLNFNSKTHRDQIQECMIEVLERLKPIIKTKYAVYKESDLLNYREVKYRIRNIFISECQKIDIYMLGLAMLSGLILAYKTNKLQSLLKYDYRFEYTILIIEKFINFNMFERYNIKDAMQVLFYTLKEFKDLENIKKIEMDGGKQFVRKIEVIYNRKNKQNKTKKSYHKKEKQTKRKNKYLNKNKNNNNKSLKRK